MEQYPNSKVNKTLQVHLKRLELCDRVSKKSECLSRHVGAILVKDNTIVAKGYNRVPKSTEACRVCIRQKKKSGEALDICKAIHAEETCILNFLKKYNYGDLKDCILYVSVAPCYNCAKLIVDAKTKAVYAKQDYNSNYTKAIFDEAGVGLFIL
jgi:dCMP deaminase